MGSACLRLLYLGWVRVLLDESLGPAPEAHDADLGSGGSLRSVPTNLVFRIDFAEELASLVDRLSDILLRAFGGNWLRELLVRGLSGQLFAVVNCGSARVFLVDGVAFLSVLLQELEEALVAANLDHVDLEVVPSLVKEGLHVALELEESLFVQVGAIRADEGAKGHVEVRAPVVLAVDAVGVELFLCDALAKVGAHLGTLDVTPESGVGHGWVTK